MHPFRHSFAGLIALVASVFAFSTEPESLEVFPPKIDLTGPNDQQRIGVLGDVDGQRRDLSGHAKFTSSDSKIVTIESGVVRPVGDGNATIAIQAGALTAAVPVSVKGTKIETPTSFVREVAPVLTKAGCNAGACH